MEKFDLDNYLEKRYIELKLERIKKCVFDYEDLLEAINTALNLADVNQLRELLVAYDNFRLMTPQKFSCSEECIEKFLETNCS